MFVSGDVLYMYTELLNSGNTQYCFAFFLKLWYRPRQIIQNGLLLLDKNINDQIRF